MNKTMGVLETLRKEKLLSIANISIMTITFLVLGTFLAIIFISQSTLAYLEQQTQVTAFFEDEFTENMILDLQTELNTDERVFSTEYISKQKALEIFMELNKDEPLLLESVSANILPASLNVKTHDIADLQPLAEEMAAIEGVEDVKFFRDVVQSFQNIANVIYIAGFILTGVFVFISYAAIVLLLRNYINRKGTELSILKLVGASNKYVRRPIVFQGIFFSLTAALLAALITTLATLVISNIYSASTTLILPFHKGTEIGLLTLSSAISLILVISSILLGLIGSHITVKKYLEY